MKAHEYFESINACDEAVTWVKDQGHDSLYKLWKQCPQGDWMLWLCQRLGIAKVQRQKVAYLAADRAVRVHAANALESAGLHKEAASLRGLKEITNKKTGDAASDAASDASDAEQLQIAKDCRRIIDWKIVRDKLKKEIK